MGIRVSHFSQPMIFWDAKESCMLEDSWYSRKWCHSSTQKLKPLVTQLCLFVTPWTVAHQALLSMGFSRQEYWSGLPFLLQEIFSTQGLNLDHQHCRQILYCLSQNFLLPLMLHPFVKLFTFDSCILPKLIHYLLLLIQMWGPAFPILYIPLSITTLYLCIFVPYPCNPLLCTVKR